MKNKKNSQRQAAQEAAATAGAGTPSSGGGTPGHQPTTPQTPNSIKPWPGVGDGIEACSSSAGHATGHGQEMVPSVAHPDAFLGARGCPQPWCWTHVSEVWARRQHELASV